MNYTRILGDRVPTQVATASGKIDMVAPPVYEGDEGWALQRPDRRLTLGIAKFEGEVVPTFLVEQEGGWGHQKAEELTSTLKLNSPIEVTGRAQSLWPMNPVEQPSPHSPTPGKSVSHHWGFAGSLGCLVQFTPPGKRRSRLGFIGASHVLAPVTLKEPPPIGDQIIMPGNIKAKHTKYRTRKNVVGTLEDYVILKHRQVEDIEEALMFNDADVALVKIEDQNIDPLDLNWVPDPNDSENNRIPLTGIIPAEELADCLNQGVFKFGRTSGFTRGIFKFISNPIEVLLPDRRIYHYDNVLIIESEEKGAFSADGDSGSLVYTADGRGLGLIIGGASKLTYLSPLSLCLEALEAEVVPI